MAHKSDYGNTKAGKKKAKARKSSKKKGNK
jgi:hypothetical protein